MSSPDVPPGPAEPIDRARPEVIVDASDDLPGRAAITARAADCHDLTEAQERTFIELLRRAFNGGPAWFRIAADPLDYLRWKGRDIPGGGELVILEQAGTMVGGVLMTREQWRLGGATRTTNGGGDLVVDSRSQGKGVLKGLNRYIVRHTHPDLDFSMHVLTNPATFTVLRVPGWVRMGNAIETLIRPLDLDRFLQRAAHVEEGEGLTYAVATRGLGRGARPRAVRALSWRARLLAKDIQRMPHRGHAARCTVQTIERFDERVDGLFDAAAAEFDFIHVRSPGTLNWRYCDPRGGRFTVRLALEGDTLVGYSAIRLSENEAALADLLVRPGRGDVACLLGEDAIALARAGGASSLRCWLPRRHAYRESLLRVGFFPRSSGPIIALLSHRLTPAEIVLLTSPDSRVHFPMGETDHV